MPPFKEVFCFSKHVKEKLSILNPKALSGSIPIQQAIAARMTPEWVKINIGGSSGFGSILFRIDFFLIRLRIIGQMTQRVHFSN